MEKNTELQDQSIEESKGTNKEEKKDFKYYWNEIIRAMIITK